MTDLSVFDERRAAVARGSDRCITCGAPFWARRFEVECGGCDLHWRVMAGSDKHRVPTVNGIFLFAEIWRKFGDKGAT